MSETYEVYCSLIAALVVVGADIGKRCGVEVAVDEHDGDIVLADPFQKGGVPVAGNDDDAIDFA